MNDYLFVRFGRKNKKYIHRLVYEAFIGFKNKKNIINHKNSNKSDNRIENLEECDNSYNIIYGYHHGERKVKPVSQYSLTGELLNTYITAKEASEKTGAYCSNICKCCKGERKKAGGFVWKYAE